MARPTAASEEVEEKNDAIKQHKDAFRRYLAYGDQTGLKELEKAAGLTAWNDLDQKSLDTVVGGGSGGHFAVPQVIDSEIGQVLLEIGTMRADAKVVTSSTPLWEKLWKIRGTSSGWVGETDPRPKGDNPTVFLIPGVFGEIFARPVASQRSLQDPVFDFEAWLSQDTLEEFMLQEGQAFVDGDGDKKPLGFLSQATAATDDKTRAFGTYQHVVSGLAGGFKVPTATVSPGDVFVKLRHKFKAQYRPNLMWRFNKATAEVVRTFKDLEGRYIWRDGLMDDQPDRLLGIRVREDEAMPDIAAGKFPVALADWNKAYTVIDIPGTDISIRDEITDPGFVNFYTSRRVGGQAIDTEAYKTIKIST